MISIKSHFKNGIRYFYQRPALAEKSKRAAAVEFFIALTLRMLIWCQQHTAVRVNGERCTAVSHVGLAVRLRHHVPSLQKRGGVVVFKHELRQEQQRNNNESQIWEMSNSSNREREINVCVCLNHF